LKKSRSWPERLGVGKPYEVDTRFSDFLELQCLEQSGNKSEASALAESIVSFTRKHQGDGSLAQLFGALQLRKVGQVNEAGKLMAEWTKSDAPESVRWLAGVYEGSRPRIQEAEKKMRGSAAGAFLGRSGMNQELALMMDVYSILTGPGAAPNLRW
jgi:hypothetical protein